MILEESASDVPTTDSEPTLIELTISLPNETVWRAFFIGAVSVMSSPDYWKQIDIGSQTPDEAAQSGMEILKALVEDYQI